MDYELLLKNGKIVDGSGSPWFKGDIAVSEGRISAVGKVNARADAIIDAEGMVVSPGFIDAHSHSDLTLMVNGRAESKIRQGVTTEVIGNCGYSPAPIMDNENEELAAELRDYELDLTWSSFAEYMESMDTVGISLNVVPLVGHGALRSVVMGYDNRRPTPEELKQMKTLLAEALEAGAAGFSSGLIYPPSSYAGVEELTELARTAARFGGIYTTHMRYEAERLIEGVREAIEVGEKSGISVQISHHKVLGPRNWGLIMGSLEMLNQARRRGVDVTFDLYPYLATATNLASILPEWAHEGGLSRMLNRLTEDTIRQEILSELIRTEEPQGWENLHISFVHSKGNKGFEGLNLKDISGKLGIKPEEAVLKLIAEEEGRVGMIRFAMCEEDLKMVLSHRSAMIGSDGSSLADYGLLGLGRPHPRNFGTFPRVLGKYVREEGVMELEEAVYRMTGLTAWRFKLQKKGLIRKGMDADLVIFDQDRIIDQATFSDPFQYPAGISKVIVGGKVVIDDGEHTGLTPGKVIKRTN